MPQGVKAGTAVLGLGLAISGIFLLGFNVVAARSLGPENYGNFSILYSMIMVCSGVLGLGIRNALAKFISEYEAQKKRREIYSVIRVCLKIESFMVIGFLVLGFLFKNLIISIFFDGNQFMFIIFILCTSVYGLISTLRGVSQGFREFKLNALSLTFESVSSVLFLIIFVVILNLGINGAALSLFVAPVFSLILLPLFHSMIKGRYIINNSGYDYKKIVDFIVKFTIFIVFRRFVLFSGPIFIKLLGGADSDELVGLFMAALILMRIPLFLFEALFGSLFPNVSRAEALKNKELLGDYIKKCSLLVTVVSVIMIASVWFAGPFVMQLLYGEEFIFGRIDLVLLSIMTSFYLIANLFNTVLIARGLLQDVLVSWTVSVAFLIIFVLSVNLDLLLRVEFGLLSSVAIVTVLLYRSLKD